MENQNQTESTWYQRVFDTINLPNSTPELDPYLDVDKYPEWVRLVVVELSRQSSHLTPVKDLAVVTPEKVGKYLGQKCANCYAIGNQLQAGITALENPQNAKRVATTLNNLEEHKENPVVASLHHSTGVTGLLIAEFANDGEAFDKIVHDAFKEALDQKNYDEAVQFFQGFAKGLSKPGLKSGKLAQATDATPIYLKIFFHWQEVDQLGTVIELYDFLLKRGFTEQTLGGIERLKTICKRIKYAPGKRKRHSRGQN
jgi:hypothetical protein